MTDCMSTYSNRISCWMFCYRPNRAVVPVIPCLSNQVVSLYQNIILFIEIWSRILSWCSGLRRQTTPASSCCQRLEYNDFYFIMMLYKYWMHVSTILYKYRMHMSTILYKYWMLMSAAQILGAYRNIIIYMSKYYTNIGCI